MARWVIGRPRGAQIGAPILPLCARGVETDARAAGPGAPAIDGLCPPNLVAPRRPAGGGLAAPANHCVCRREGYNSRQSRRWRGNARKWHNLEMWPVVYGGPPAFWGLR